MNNLNDNLFVLEHKQKNKEIINLLKNVTVFLLIVIFLPAFAYLLFSSGLIKSKSVYSSNIEQPVALVMTNSGSGTAFLVGETRLLTAKHVVEDMDIGEILQLVFEKAQPPITTEARLIWKNPDNRPAPEYYEDDFAVLELTIPGDIPENFPRMTLGSSVSALTRDEVILVGYPQGIFSATTGTISNDNIKGLDLFLLDAGAWPGNSGGPLILKETEEVIGILIAGFEGEYIGMNMANKIDEILVTLDSDFVYVNE